ncbi:Uma2 family endonuclease [Nostoc sp. WHI]|uniref:Uma2 family endonuclease n=1 Tax=Nostoc sp. WHI TaxID=2650611 RepID=UPI0018C54284|nr:Uma2 family endonuclease [Nostoc sp. WHI]MBG1266108.1 Uma2 family endonuclease [Nostoc sp. WHI]
MVQEVLINDDYYVPDANQLITEDDKPVDNFASEKQQTPVDNFAFAKQQRLLVSSLYSSLQSQTFLAEANVGIYYTDLQPPIVPDVLLSLDVQVPKNCYMVWHFGKPPEVVLEIVSNKEGGELGNKLKIYEQIRASYYIVYDPNQQLGEKVLHVYEIRGRRYFETSENWLDQVGLGVTLWEGQFEGRQDTWLRWCYQDGTVLLTGDERAEQEGKLAKQAEQRAQLLADRLRAMGVDPDTL